MGRKGKRRRAGKGREDSEDVAAGREEAVGQKGEAAREALNWVVGRLNVLEFLILFLALVLALLGGALVAWLLGPALPISFRWLWAVVSLLLFILPGGWVYLREFRERGASPNRGPKSKPKRTKEPNG